MLQFSSQSICYVSLGLFFTCIGCGWAQDLFWDIHRIRESLSLDLSLSGFLPQSSALTGPFSSFLWLERWVSSWGCTCLHHLMWFTQRGQPGAESGEKERETAQNKNRYFLCTLRLTASLFLVLWLNREDFSCGFCFLHSVCSSMTQATLGTKLRESFFLFSKTQNRKFPSLWVILEVLTFLPKLSTVVYFSESSGSLVLNSVQGSCN